MSEAQGFQPCEPRLSGGLAWLKLGAQNGRDIALAGPAIGPGLCHSANARDIGASSSQCTEVPCQYPRQKTLKIGVGCSMIYFPSNFRI